MTTPKLCIRHFKIQEKVNVFNGIYGHKLDIKLDHTQRTTKHIMQEQGID